MSEESRPPLNDLLADHNYITEAIRRGVKKAVLDHARAGQSVAVGRDGKVVWLSPQEILDQFAEDRS